VLLYWDKNARDPGVRVRWLDPDGRIGMMSEVVAAAKPGLTWPAPVLDVAEGGGFWIAWQQDSDKDTDDLYLRRLGRDLKPMGPEIRLTDYEPEKGHVPRASSPSLAVSADNVFITYGVDRDHQHVIERMRIQRASSDLDGGLQGAAKGGRVSREFGDVTAISEPRVNGDYPAMACAADGCFVAWHELDKGGAQAAFLDPAGGALLWRKRFAPHGGHPALAAAPGGKVAVAYYESGRVRVASVTRDGVGVPSVLARVTGDPPRPWIAAGRAPGDWYVAWLDVEAGHTEPLVARVQCRD
jgi:serine/threonine-protein kinase